MIASRVHRKGVRPAIFRKWNDLIGEMLRCAWDADLHQRPNFLEITLVLKQELVDSERASVQAGSTISVGSVSTHGNNAQDGIGQSTKQEVDDDSAGRHSQSSIRRPEARTVGREE
jgi:hypothetical protein